MSESSVMEFRWRLVPHFLLRRAGFPFSHINTLACPRTAALASEVARLEARRAALREDLLRRQLPAAVLDARARQDRVALRLLSDWRKRVGRGRARPLPGTGWAEALRAAADDWVQTAEGLQARSRELEAVAREESLQVRHTLRAFFRQPQVREALFLLSPDLVEASEARLDRAPSPEPDHDERALERRLYAFIQRLCAKNETTSFFGPLAYGWVDRELEQFHFGDQTASGVTRREVFLAFWAAAALAAAASADDEVRAALPVRRVAVARVDEEGARRPDGSRVRIDEVTARVYAHVDDRLPVDGLARAAGLDRAETEAAVSRLEKHGLVRRTIEPLSTTPHPLQDVMAQLPPVPASARWRETFEGFEALLRQFEGADLAGRRAVLRTAEERFSRVTGVAARRAAGGTYADRTILYEDCLGDMQPVRMPPRDAARLERAFAPALELGRTFGTLRYRAVRTLATQVLEKSGGRAAFLTFADAMDAQVRAGQLEPLLEPSRALKEALAARVQRAAQGQTVRLEPADVAELLRPYPAEDGGRFASPDVMFQVDEAGRTHFVIGEVHPYVFAWGSQGYFSPAPEQLQASFVEDLGHWGGGARIAMVLRRRRHKGLVTQAFPGTFIEVTGRGTDDPRRRVAIADLEVRMGANGPQLFGPTGELILYVGEDDHPHLRAFAPPQVEMPQVRMDAHTPRILVGELVYQRERWDLADGALADVRLARHPAALAVAVCAARAANGWPRFVFAMSPHEPKPICLDLEVPFAHAMLQRLLNLGRLAISEMLPDPDGLWLARAGGRHTSELRMAMVRDS